MLLVLLVLSSLLLPNHNHLRARVCVNVRTRFHDRSSG